MSNVADWNTLRVPTSEDKLIYSEGNCQIYERRNPDGSVLRFRGVEKTPWFLLLGVSETLKMWVKICDWDQYRPGFPVNISCKDLVFESYSSDPFLVGNSWDNCMTVACRVSGGEVALCPWRPYPEQFCELIFYPPKQEALA